MRTISAVLAVTTLLGGTPLVATAGEKVSPVGYYETAPGKLGERNRLSVSSLGAGKYSVSVATVYCAYAFSPDCSNAKTGALSFDTELKENALNYSEAQSDCVVSVTFSKDFATYKQTGNCSSNQYGMGVHKYEKKSSTPQELSP